jgi:hypothetical protein
VIRKDQYPLRKVRLESAISCLVKLSANAFVSANLDRRRTPPLLYRNHKDAKMLFRHRHPRIVPIFLVDV